VSADAIKHLRKTLWRRGRAAVIVAHVQVHKRRPSLESLVRGLDLFLDANGHRRVVAFLRQGTSDGYRDDAWAGHVKILDMGAGTGLDWSLMP
jgi:hypothetical protein